MKKKKILSLLTIIASLGLLSCTNVSSTPAGSSEQPSSTGTQQNSSTSLDKPSSSSSIDKPISSTTTSPIDDSTIRLITFGDLYPNSMRAFFAEVDGLEGYTLIWSSSDENIVTISAREGSMREAFAVVRSLGECTISVKVSGRDDLVASKTFNITEGEAMPENLYTKVDGGVKVTSEDKLYNYDANFDKTLVQEFQGTTIFEETRPEDQSVDNLTDAYQIDILDITNDGEEDFHAKYVKTVGDKVGLEYISDQNTLESDRYYNDDGEDLSWEYSYYVNLLNEADPEYGFFGRENFRTYDGGETYHYIGGYLGTSYLMANYLMVDITLDDLYFVVNDDQSLSMVGIIDPYNSEDPLSEIRYGREIHIDFSETDTAKIDHLAPYEHEEYHDRIDEATEKMAQAKNYTATISYSLGSDHNYDFVTTFKFTEDTIDEVTVDSEGNITSHTGIHKKDESSYVEYSYIDETKELSILETHYQAWDAVNRYPTFDFASEIFEESNDPNIFVTREDSATFVAYCCYLATVANYATYMYPGSITLDENNNLVSFHGEAREFGESTTLSIDGTYSEVGTTVVDIDFESDVVIPDSWDTDATASQISEFLVVNGIIDRVPYLYSPVGYDTAAHNKTNDPVNMYYTTKDFATEEERDAFIQDYQDLMLTNGYTDSGEQLDNFPYKKYTNADGDQFGVGPELTWNDSELMSVKIVFVFHDIDSYESSYL